jgi:hypothetical protein
VKGGGSYLSANDSRILFGLGSNPRVEKLQVRWPSGEEQVVPGNGIEINRYQKVTEE